VEIYKDLSEVERAFSGLKDVIEMRPIYHRTVSRVEAHIFVASAEMGASLFCLVPRRWCVLCSLLPFVVSTLILGSSAALVRILVDSYPDGFERQLELALFSSAKSPIGVSLLLLLLPPLFGAGNCCRCSTAAGGSLVRHSICHLSHLLAVCAGVEFSDLAVKRLSPKTRGFSEWQG